MIDLHTHILPDLDDGAATLDEALAMARMAADDGIRVMAATPHSLDSIVGERYSVAVVRERAEQLVNALAAARIPLQIVVGTEIHYTADLVKQLASGKVLSYAGTHTILLELPYHGIPSSLEMMIFNLQVAGYRVILAHPERTIEVQRNPAILAPLTKRGVLMQITAEALTGKQGANIQKTTETLIICRMAHILASDSHGLPPRRAPLLAEARNRAANLIGAAEADALVERNPAAILADQLLELPEPQAFTQRH